MHFYMHYYIDIVAHTTAFDTPVVGHWLGKTLKAISKVVLDMA